MNELERFHSKFDALVKSDPQKSVIKSMVTLADMAGKSPRIHICTAQKKGPNGGIISTTSAKYLSHIYEGSFDPFIVMVEESHNAARQEGLFGLMRVKAEAWLEERLTEASARKLRSRQVILEEQRKTVEANQRLHSAVRSFDADQRFQQSPPQQPQKQQTQPQIPNHSSPAPPPLRPSISDEQIETSAIRALLEGATNEERWAPYKEALMIQLPPYAVQEIENRLHELWQYNPEGVDIKYR